MKMNRQSWHYRLVQFLPGEAKFQIRDGTNLCRYFWLVMCCVFIKIPALTLISVTALILSPLLIPCIGIVVLVCWCLDKREKAQQKAKLAAGIYPWEDFPQKPSLVREWLRAKKEKVCPMIEWES